MLLNMAMGRLTRDPELRYVNIGGDQVPVCEFSIAVNIGYGQNQQTEFINCVAWRKKAENIANYLSKGRMVLVRGTQKTSKYQDNNGVDRYKTEWVIDDFNFCDSAQNNNQGGQSQGQQNRPQPQDQSQGGENPYMANNQFYEMAQGNSGGSSSGAPF